MEIRKVFNKLRKLAINLDRRVRILTRTQMVIVEHMGRGNTDFQNDYIKAMMSIKEIRDGFSKDVLESDKANDTLKTQVMEINEIFNEMEEE
jgi:hypothetical protein